ncbi:hypothetical protein AC579_2824 [Pseudocercospora musae]|uniref:Uncharacterized protein n=1 Tax=Pseudocercospora musae TaxID=113226 RepID=A0A139IKL7_9PEZI|nr:hypothetical protein AC579_2824 [Pseudocercospora musae]
MTLRGPCIRSYSESIQHQGCNYEVTAGRPTETKAFAPTESPTRTELAGRPTALRFSLLKHTSAAQITRPL